MLFRFARVLEFDPRTLAFPWFYPGQNAPPFVNETQGECQRLPNGNTLIVVSNEGDLHEVTPAGELVWSLACNCHMPWARRFAPDELEFLKGAHRARP